MGSLLAPGVVVCGACAALCLASVDGRGSSGEGLAHAERSFEFTIEGPMASVAPLFGADRERLWAADWRPRFLWPARAADREGMVFAVTSAHGTAVWINTAYDPEHGRFQYAYLLPEIVATLITVSLTPDGVRTRASVTYCRTALSPESSALVARMADHDARSGPEWAEQINGYLRRGADSPP
jgi:hypothetical protein